MKYKDIKSFFKFTEFKDDGKTKYGWIISVIPIEMPCLISYYAEKEISDDDRSFWGDTVDDISAISIEDAKKFIKNLTGYTADQIVAKKYGKSFKVTEFERNLSALIENGKEFVFYGRIFKVIDERNTST